MSKFYKPEIVDAILDRLAAGETLNAICRSERMPSAPLVHQWVLDNVDGFAERYARARNLGLAIREDELIDISDDSSQDRKVDGDGKACVDQEHINRARLRIDTRKWLMSKMRPDKYGDRLDIGNAGGVPFQVNHHIHHDVADAEAIVGVFERIVERRTDPTLSELQRAQIGHVLGRLEHFDAETITAPFYPGVREVLTVMRERRAEPSICEAERAEIEAIFAVITGEAEPEDEGLDLV